MPHTLTRWIQSITVYRALFLTLACLSLYTFEASAGQVYKWVDEKGVVTFGDKSQRPASTPVETVKIQTREPPPKVELSPDEAAKAEKDAKAAAEKQKQATEQAAAETPKMPPAEKRQRCSEARSDLAAIQSRGQVRERDAKGNYTYMTEEQKQSRIKASKKDVREYCH